MIDVLSFLTFPFQRKLLHIRLLLISLSIEVGSTGLFSQIFLGLPFLMYFGANKEFQKKKLKKLNFSAGAGLKTDFSLFYRKNTQFSQCFQKLGPTNMPKSVLNKPIVIFLEYTVVKDVFYQIS